MSNLIIVAIPDENDYVWKISSEKVPHLSLLFLGEMDQIANVDKIVEFVEHAANTSLSRFYMTVDRRDKLGEDEADVLFFKKTRYDYKAIRDFRAVLLQNSNIKTAYDSATQFEGPWTPHLTLGYPAAPAKLDEHDRDFYSVEFTKIAVWTDEYDGPEFVLKDFWDEYETMDAIPMDVAMSALPRARMAAEDMGLIAERGAEFLEHYGVKGMRWGVRKQAIEGGGHIRISNRTNVAHPSARSSTLFGLVGAGALASDRARREDKAANVHNKARRQEKKVQRQDKRFEKRVKKADTYLRLHDKAVTAGKADRTAIDNKPEYKNAKFGLRGKDRNTPLHEKYLKEHYDLYVKNFNAVANNNVNASGTRQYAFRDLPNAGKWSAKRELYLKNVKHAADDDDEPTLIVELLLDSDGKVTGVKAEPKEDFVAQFVADIGAEFILQHYGVKGMRWGVRNQQELTTQSHIDTGLVRRRTQVVAKGGEAHPAHDDAVKAAVTRQKLKKSGTDALSNQELRELASRVQLENQVTLLTSSKGKRFVQQQLEEQGKQEVKKGAARAAPHVIRKVRRGAAAGATVAALV